MYTRCFRTCSFTLISTLDSKDPCVNAGEGESRDSARSLGQEDPEGGSDNHSSSYLRTCVGRSLVGCGSVGSQRADTTEAT